jgi:aminoglycoside phosphotransferase (APT) family kinase protein
VKTAVLRRASAIDVEPAPDTLPGASEETRHALHGHSGASVVLHTSSSHSFVRKTAADASLNDRLLAQARKQRDLGRSGIPFPRIFVSGLVETGHAFFDMAYVPGRTVADAVANAAPFDVNAVLSAVEKMLWLFRACKGAPIPDEQFLGKIAAIERAGTERMADDPALSDAIRACAARMAGMAWDGIPQSPSHGDLTLENIMLGADRSIMFIDCDEAWISSYWLDIGKLFQDCFGHWCLRDLYRAAETPVQLANAIEKLETVASAFRALVEDSDPRPASHLGQLTALNLFRALPYAREPHTASFICARVLSVLDA